MDFITDIYERLRGVSWESLFFTLRDVFLVLDALLIVAFIYVFVMALRFRPLFVLNPRPKKRAAILQNRKLQERWVAIVGKARRRPPQSLTLGIIEADSFIDDVLKKMDLRGEHMADRMEQLTRMDLKSADNLWKAHRVRNDLVHTSGFTLSKGDAERALQYYEDFLKEVGMLG